MLLPRRKDPDCRNLGLAGVNVESFYPLHKMSFISSNIYCMKMKIGIFVRRVCLKKSYLQWCTSALSQVSAGADVHRGHDLSPSMSCAATSLSSDFLPLKFKVSHRLSFIYSAMFAIVALASITIQLFFKSF